MIGGLLKQAITATKEVPRKLVESKEKRGNLELQEAVDALSELLQGFEKIYLCVDALDECSDEVARWNLVSFLQELADKAAKSESIQTSIVRIFLTGRHQIKEQVSCPYGSSANTSPSLVSVVLKAHTDDIAAYITYRLSRYSP